MEEACRQLEQLETKCRGFQSAVRPSELHAISHYRNKATIELVYTMTSHTWESEGIEEGGGKGLRRDILFRNDCKMIALVMHDVCANSTL